MNTNPLRSYATLALASLVALACALAACSDAAAPAGNGQPASAANTNAAAPVAVAPAVQQPGAARPPLGMEDAVEGYVIGLVCFKSNPKAPAAEAKACALANVDKGGALGILGPNNTVYVDAQKDLRITNSKLRDFVGQEVSIQGQMIGDVPELSWGEYTVKKFDMKLVRRKGPPPPDAPKTAGQGGAKIPTPAKKP